MYHLLFFFYMQLKGRYFEGRKSEIRGVPRVTRVQRKKFWRLRKKGVMMGRWSGNWVARGSHIQTAPKLGVVWWVSHSSLQLISFSHQHSEHWCIIICSVYVEIYDLFPARWGLPLQLFHLLECDLVPDFPIPRPEWQAWMRHPLVIPAGDNPPPRVCPATTCLAGWTHW